MQEQSSTRIYNRRVKRPIVVPVGPSIAYIPLGKDHYALIDSDDAERCGEFNWFRHVSAKRSVYAQSRWTGTRKLSSLHSFVFAERADHINGNGLDCRRSNLRMATQQQNCWNQRYRGGKSGIKGVVKTGKSTWRAMITFNGKSIKLGSFTSPEDASKAYTTAAREFFGEFARIN